MHDYWTLEPKYKTFDEKLKDTKCKPIKEYYYKCSRSLDFNISDCETRLTDYKICKQTYDKISKK